MEIYKISILLAQDRHSLPLDLPFPAKSMARTCVIVLHKRERQLAAPWREETAEALRRCVAARAKPASCLRQGRKGPSETFGADVLSVLHKRGASRRSKARRDSPSTGQLPYGLRWESGTVGLKPA